MSGRQPGLWESPERSRRGGEDAFPPVRHSPLDGSFLSPGSAGRSAGGSVPRKATGDGEGPDRRGGNFGSPGSRGDAGGSSSSPRPRRIPHEGLRPEAASHTAGAEDLAALRRRVHDRDPAPETGGPRPGSGDGLRVSGGNRREDRRRGVHRRDLSV